MRGGLPGHKGALDGDELLDFRASRERRGGELTEVGGVTDRVVYSA